MSNETVLIIEDDEDIQELLRYNLDREGYTLLCESHGKEGLKTAQGKIPQLILLDLMLPGLDGLSICKQLKADRSTKHIPIIMLSAKGEESDIVIGLEMGADDYITKPFSPRVLLAHIRAVLRRKAQQATDEETGRIIFDGLEIDPQRHQVKVDGQSIDLTSTEFDVLHFLSQRPGWVFTRQQMVDSIRGQDYAVTERSVDVQIVGLRKKLGSQAELIQTVRGVGYRFKERAQ